jgi:lipopolysaccharide transport system ATP-binding protein
MSSTVLEVSGLGKAFRRYRRELDRVAGWLGLSVSPAEERWVLQDIGFSVGEAEAIGIVGRNGAGKSTLLKMIAGTMRPSMGTVHVKGKVAAILELGMGFNPELTGRQNAYHASGMMGFQRSETDAVIDEIAEFSELKDYFGQPLRVYSSGMQMRLAFAVATAVRPDVLIVDEALAVGDAYFQHKSMERIRAFREQGTALILVSHDKAAVQSLCDRAILLEGGRLVLDGTPESVLDYYNALLALQENETIETERLDGGRVRTISGSRKAAIEKVILKDAKGTTIDTIKVSSELVLEIAVRVNKPLPRLVLGYAIKDRLGQTLYGTNTHYSNQVLDALREGEQITYRIRFPVMLGPGSYSIALSLSAGESHMEENYEWRDLAALFNVVNHEAPFDGKTFMPGTIEVMRNQ